MTSTVENDADEVQLLLGSGTVDPDGSVRYRIDGWEGPAWANDYELAEASVRWMYSAKLDRALHERGRAAEVGVELSRVDRIELDRQRGVSLVIGATEVVVGDLELSVDDAGRLAAEIVRVVGVLTSTPDRERPLD